TVIQAMSQPFAWAVSRPLHPVGVDWKDRTWFSGGALSVVVRTLAVLVLFTWLQRAVAGITWRQWRTLLKPAHLVSIVGATVAFTIALGPAYRSLHDADGNSQWWIIGAIV